MYELKYEYECEYMNCNNRRRSKLCRFIIEIQLQVWDGFFLSSAPSQGVYVSLCLSDSYSRRFDVLAVVFPTGIRSPQASPVSPCVVAVRTSFDVVHVIEHPRGHGSVAHWHLRKRSPSPKFVGDRVFSEPERRRVPVLGENLLANRAGRFEAFIGLRAPIELSIKLAGGRLAYEFKSFAAWVE